MCMVEHMENDLEITVNILENIEGQKQKGSIFFFTPILRTY